MRPLWPLILLPLALVGCSDKPAEKHASQDPKSAVVDPAKIHPSTPDMQSRAAQRDGTKAPAFELQDQDGRPQTLASLAKGKPALIYFVNHECPCCITAEPFIERLHEQMKDDFALFAIVDSDVATTKAWRDKYGFPGPMLADPTLKTIAAFGIETAVYQVLVGPDGTIEKLYAGYNQQSLQDAANRIAVHAKKTAPKIDLSDAPVNMTAGCTFNTP